MLFTYLFILLTPSWLCLTLSSFESCLLNIPLLRFGGGTLVWVCENVQYDPISVYACVRACLCALPLLTLWV